MARQGGAYQVEAERDRTKAERCTRSTSFRFRISDKNNILSQHIFASIYISNSIFRTCRFENSTSNGRDGARHGTARWDEAGPSGAAKDRAARSRARCAEMKARRIGASSARYLVSYLLNTEDNHPGRLSKARTNKNPCAPRNLCSEQGGGKDAGRISAPRD